MRLPQPLAALLPRTVVLHSPLPADEVLARLRQRGREWRESQVPAPLREQGVLRMDVRLRGNRFSFSYRGSRYAAMPARLTGTVQPAPSGSRVAVRVTLHPVLRVVAVAWAAQAVLVAATFGASQPSERVILALGMVAPGLLLAALGSFADRTQHDQLLATAHEIAAVPLPTAPEPGPAA